MEFISSALAWLTGNQEVVVTVLGFVLMAVVKLTSNEKAGPFVVVLQKWVDGIAKFIQIIADILAQAIKSDGFLGKK